MTTVTPDERELAFTALLPLARRTDDALRRVQELVNDERHRTSLLRAGFHPTQHAALHGSSRFAYAVREWGGALETDPRIVRISTDSQEARNIWLWLLEDRFVLRIKHDLDDIKDPGAATLFSLAPMENRPVVFLTWETAPDATIGGVCFATLGEAGWTITLDDLLEKLVGTPAAVPTPRPQVTVSSKRPAARKPKRDQQGDRG